MKKLLAIALFSLFQFTHTEVPSLQKLIIKLLLNLSKDIDEETIKKTVPQEVFDQYSIEKQRQALASRSCMMAYAYHYYIENFPGHSYRYYSYQPDSSRNRYLDCCYSRKLYGCNY